jgi:4a-hydroxytetrahydrobiopterin dehydratase
MHSCLPKLGFSFILSNRRSLNRKIMELKQHKCEACSDKSAPITPQEIEQFKPEIPDWKIIDHQEGLRLERIYTFPNFKTALDFTNRVGDEAEKEGHHPALLTEWGKVTVTWWTHAISGLHKNDFIMAARTDAVRKSME